MKRVNVPTKTTRLGTNKKVEKETKKEVKNMYNPKAHLAKANEKIVMAAKLKMAIDAEMGNKIHICET